MNSYTTLLFPTPRLYPHLIPSVMQNHLTKWAIVHTDSSLLFLVAESCRLEVELGNCNQTSFGFVPEHLSCAHSA